MNRIVSVAAAGIVVIGGALTPPAISSAASNTATTLLPANDTDQLETHSWLDCKSAGAHCDFIAGVQLRTPEGVTGFPPDVWARQSTEVRGSSRAMYLDVHTAGGEGNFADRGGPGTKVFKEGGTAVITSMYNGDGPPEKYQTVGTIDSVSQATGQPFTDGKVFVCATVQVVYAGVNLATPSTCAQASFS